MNKVVFVKARFKPVGETIKVKVPTGEKKKTWFGGEKDVMVKEKRWEQTGWSDCEIDGTRLSKDLQAAINDLNSDGYEVISVSPIESGSYEGKYDYKYSDNGGYGYGYGYGFSYTEGITVIAKKIN